MRWTKNNEPETHVAFLRLTFSDAGSTPAASTTTFMPLRFQLEYWKDGSWFVGRLPQVPGVFSQGATLEELEENVLDAYRLMIEDQETVPVALAVHSKEIEVLK